jgi:hypothetical protein
MKQLGQQRLDLACPLLDYPLPKITRFILRAFCCNEMRQPQLPQSFSAQA